jgi:hypothetical protein
MPVLQPTSLLRRTIAALTAWSLLGTAIAPAWAETAADLPVAATPTGASTSESEQMDAAVQAMLDDRLEEALGLLDSLAKTATDPVRRAMAVQLAGQIRKARPELAEPLPGGKPRVNQEGRTALLAATTLLGLSMYGPSVPIVLDTTDDRATVGLYLLTASSSFLLPYFATRDAPVTWGMTNLAVHGGTSGAVHGVLTAYALTGEMDDQTSFGAAMLGSVVELTAGALWAKEAKLSAGDAHLTAIGMDLGSAWITGLTRLALQSTTETSSRVLAATPLLGAVAGFAAAETLRGFRRTTWGDAEVIRTTALLGGFAGLTASSWSGLEQDEGGRRTTTLATLLSIGGAVGGDVLVREQDLSVGQALLIDLGTVAGGLLAAGLTYLATDSDEPSTYLTAALAGGGAGFGLSMWAQSKPVGKRAAGVLERGVEGLPLPSLSPSSALDSEGKMAPGLALGGRF